MPPRRTFAGLTFFPATTTRRPLIILLLLPIGVSRAHLGTNSLLIEQCLILASFAQLGMAYGGLRTRLFNPSEICHEISAIDNLGI